MPPTVKQTLKAIFPASSSLLGPRALSLLEKACSGNPDPDTVAAEIARTAAAEDLPGYLADLAAVEAALSRVQQSAPTDGNVVDGFVVNPTLQVIPCSHRGMLVLALAREGAHGRAGPEPGEEMNLIWRHPKTGKLRTAVAGPDDLLALKVVVEELDRQHVAAEGGLPVGIVDEAVGRAVRRGIILGPASRIRREDDAYPVSPIRDEEFLSSTVFTIQWHITQACDLHCKHCYDRSARATVSLDEGIRILDDLREFCLARNVWGQVSFSGGNPLLHPRFLDLYRGATERGFATAVLGNPTDPARIDELLAIQAPVFYQISMEGLREHNDLIRGKGHFDRAVSFLDDLRERGVFSMVMLTLTRDNIDQVLPLGEFLRDRVDLFTFNRLAMVGEGANLRGPTPERFRVFLEHYLEAAERNPVIRLKDNLINIIRERRGQPPFGGCAGHGCGAAFNFVSILPDGEVHACRKLPSLIGSVNRQTLGEIYDSPVAARYRQGPAACRSCRIRPVCGGCLAVVYGHGLDVFKDKDPYCFID